MRMRVRRFLRWRTISWPAACGIRWVNPSMATVSPSRMVLATASASDRKRDIAGGPSQITVSSHTLIIYGSCRVRSNGATVRMEIEMPSNARVVRIEWGDCDPAGIVFYPRYFAMFDHSTTLLIERTLGMSKHQLQAAYAFVGYPMVESRARFLLPTRYGDDVVIETSLTGVRRSSFDLTHRLSLDGGLAVEGFETRVWTVRDEARPGGLKSQPIPPQLVARLTAP